jgi:hypothetical protein
MRMHRFFSLLFGGSLLAAASVDARAAEYAFSSYGLGSAAFGAGVTPPPGTYVTTAVSYYTATIGTTVSFGGGASVSTTCKKFQLEPMILIGSSAQGSFCS